MNVHEKIKVDYKFYNLKPMSNDIDLVSELILIDYLKPKTCWEIGTGKGDWALCMNLYMKTNAQWNLTENFDWANTDNIEKQKYIPSDWPKNEQDIHNHINDVVKLTNTPFEYNLYKEDISELWHCIDDPVDLWRIDCDLDNDEATVESMLDYSSNNVIFFVDDIESNRCINRLCTMMEQVRKGNLDLIFMGKGEAAWIKPNVVDTAELFDLFKAKQDYFNKWLHVDDKKIFNQRREYFQVE
jgi:hypothetical protein